MKLLQTKAGESGPEVKIYFPAWILICATAALFYVGALLLHSYLVG